MARISKGRKRVEMKKMTNENNLQVAFSNRRFGVFKKVSELCTLCGVDAAVVIFSPRKKAFSFGHKSVDSVIERYLNGTTPPSAGPAEMIQSYRENTIRNLNAQLMLVTEQLDMEKKRGKELSKIRKASQAECWWQNPVSEMSKEQLGQLKLAMEELRKNVAQQTEAILSQKLKNDTESLAPNSGAADLMLPIAGTSGLSDSDGASLMPPPVTMTTPAAMAPPPAVPPANDYGFGSNGSY